VAPCDGFRGDRPVAPTPLPGRSELAFDRRVLCSTQST
jgi:hypothetical protein